VQFDIVISKKKKIPIDYSFAMLSYDALQPELTLFCDINFHLKMIISGWNYKSLKFWVSNWMLILRKISVISKQILKCLAMSKNTKYRSITAEMPTNVLNEDGFWLSINKNNHRNDGSSWLTLVRKCYISSRLATWSVSIIGFYFSEFVVFPGV
jgi:hypothetical protein